MPTTTIEPLQIGTVLPPLQLDPVNRTMLALFAGASNDHNAIHIDLDFARQAGMPDVFAHGMLSMAWLGRLLTRWIDQRQLRTFSVRFAGITHLGHRISCTGKVVDIFEADGERRARLEIQTANQDGGVLTVGDATVAI